ncbi:MAG: ABC transporter permease [Fibrobacteria bacterium]|nr:ABC transporter permease [Fibrobacteria bacterium]
MRRFLALFRKELLQIRRDPGSLRLLFMLPILQTLVLGYAMTRDVRGIAMGIVDLDHSGSSLSVSHRLRSNARFIDHGNLPDPEAARHALTRGDLSLVLVIPADFEHSLEHNQVDGGPPEAAAPVQILVDGQDAATAATSAAYASAILGQWGQERLEKDLISQGMDARTLLPLEIRDRILFNPELEFSWSMIPGMVILLVTMVGALLTSFSIVRERENGTLEQLLVTPVRPIQILLGKALPYWILSQVVFWLAFLIASTWFRIPLGGLNLPGLAIGMALYAMTSISLGILVSTIAGTQQQALFLIWFFLIFFILTSGFLLPFESMPVWMQNLTEGNAVRHFLYMVRALAIRSADPMTLLPEYLKLLAIGIVLFGASVFAFRRKAA